MLISSIQVDITILMSIDKQLKDFVFQEEAGEAVEEVRVRAKRINKKRAEQQPKIKQQTLDDNTDIFRSTLFTIPENNHFQQYIYMEESLNQTANGFNFSEKEAIELKQPPMQPRETRQIQIEESARKSNAPTLLPIQRKRKKNSSTINSIPMESAHIINSSKCNEITTEYLKHPILPEQTLSCSVHRNTQGSGLFSVQYDLYIKPSLKLILKCKKQPKCCSTDYLVFGGTANEPIGRIRRNFMNTKYNVYAFEQNNEELISTITYENELSLTPQINDIEVYIKESHVRYESMVGYKKEKRQNLQDLYALGDNNVRILKLINKKPQWNYANKCNALNFRGKCKIPSQKNTIIVEENLPQEYLLIFGKLNSDIYNMQICYPFCPLVAIGLAITTFDFRITCV